MTTNKKRRTPSSGVEGRNRILPRDRLGDGDVGDDSGELIRRCAGSIAIVERVGEVDGKASTKFVQVRRLPGQAKMSMCPRWKREMPDPGRIASLPWKTWIWKLVRGRRCRQSRRDRIEDQQDDRDGGVGVRRCVLLTKRREAQE